MRRFTFLILLIPFFSSAQFRNNIWCFGDSAGIDFSNANNPIAISTVMRGRGSCVSIADSTGGLLFYASTRAGIGGCHTTQVWNKIDQVMDNGDSIIGEGWYKELLIIPINNNIYYLFSSSEIGCTLGFEGLYFSIIDLNNNGGLGKVTQKNVQLLNFQPCDGLAAIKHGNGRDWWLFVRQWDYQTTTHDFDEFHTFLITPDSILGPYTQHIGSFSNNGFYRIEPSNDGSKIACTERRGIIEIFDFDRCSGMLTNPLTIEARRQLFSYAPSYWSCELSQDKSKLYVSSIYTGQNQDSTYLFQYDLNATDIEASRDTLSALQGQSFGGGYIELAPDGKIYYSMSYKSYYPYEDTMYNYINMNLGVINFPDSLGQACNFLPFSFYLGGKRSYVALPNNPNYDLPALGGSICDTLGLWNHTPDIATQQSKLNLFYHSDWQTAFINASNLQGKNYSLHLINLEGKEIFFETGNLSSAFFTKDLRCNQLSPGVYFILLETEKEKLVQKFIVE
jgi:hypothetical protein